MSLHIFDQEERESIKIRFALEMLRAAEEIRDDRNPITRRFAVARTWRDVLVRLGRKELDGEELKSLEDLERVARKLVEEAMRVLSPHLV